MDYRIGRNNFALTIFIPTDCKNNCKFCTSKASYVTNRPNLNNVLKAIEIVGSKHIDIHDIVITGGEPFADLEVLGRVLSKIKLHVNYTGGLYINTSLPMKNIFETIVYINGHEMIDGVNISRHLTNVFAEETAPDEAILLITKSKHFNCVLTNPENLPDSAFVDYVNRMRSLNGQITFRADYRTITQANLHSFDYPLFKRLDNLFGHVETTGCHVCNTDRFNDNIVLHRGIERSHLEFANYIEVNDLVIRQDGLIMYDWYEDCVATNDVLDGLRWSTIGDSIYNDYIDDEDDDDDDECYYHTSGGFVADNCGGPCYRTVYVGGCGAGSCGGYYTSSSCGG